MGDKMRWRYGDTNPIVAAVDSSTVIEIGDLVYQDNDDVKPASAMADQGSKTANQQDFAFNFLGVAMQRSRSGDTSSIRIATTGVFEFDCPSDTCELGDMFGVDENSAGDQLLNQQVISVSASKYAIGRVAKRVPTAGTIVLIDILSTIMTGGVWGSAPSTI